MGENKAEGSATSLVEGPALPITGHKLNGQNYPQWVRSVKIFLQGKGKEGYITGDSKSPKKGDPNLNKWKLENSLVMSWLLNTMTNEIGENFMYYDTAKEMWDAVKETYSNVDNTSAVFEIKSILHDLRQSDFSVTKYFNTLSRHWQQLDMYEDVQWSCTEDKKKYKELVEKDRIYKFLLGLNTELDEVRGRILGTKPLKTIREVFSEVRREESRRKVMLGKSSAAPSIEGSAMAARGNQPRPSQKKNQPWCDHCKKLDHTKDTCWIIHGRPSEAKQTKNLDSRSNTVEGEQTYPIEVVESQLLGFELAESAPNAEPAKTAPAAEETAVANAEPAETAPATEETAPTEARGPATYFRKRRKGVESNTAPRQSHESNQAPENEFSLGNIVSNPEPIDDIDIPIALRKGVRSCTQHPIEKYVSYGKLSQGYRSFVAALDNTHIPRNVQEALQQPEWAAAVTEEV
ncbi:Gag-polypeptide of LTR copia-type [Sesbania bispinosa]|nr:Gag-polypeptide of LTR copia-type [Sesbania bispinosa]